MEPPCLSTCYVPDRKAKQISEARETRTHVKHAPFTYLPSPHIVPSITNARGLGTKNSKWRSKDKKNPHDLKFSRAQHWLITRHGRSELLQDFIQRCRK